MKQDAASSSDEMLSSERLLRVFLGVVVIITLEAFLLWLAVQSNPDEILRSAEQVRASIGEFGRGDSLLVSAVVLFIALVFMAPLHLSVVIFMLLHGSLLGAGAMAISIVAVLWFTYGLGRMISQSRAGQWLRATRAYRSLPMTRISQSLVAVFAIRLFPLGPFAFANILCGVIPIRTIPFIAGSLLSIAPSTISLTAVTLGMQTMLERGKNASEELLALWLTGLAVYGALQLWRWKRARLIERSRFAAAREPPNSAFQKVCR